MKKKNTMCFKYSLHNKSQQDMSEKKMGDFSKKNKWIRRKNRCFFWDGDGCPQTVFLRLE